MFAALGMANLQAATSEPDYSYIAINGFPYLDNNGEGVSMLPRCLVNLLPNRLTL
jgi:hypothetical protein